MISNKQTLALSSVAIAAVIVLFASGPLVANSMQAQAFRGGNFHGFGHGFRPGFGFGPSFGGGFGGGWGGGCCGGCGCGGGW